MKLHLRADQYDEIVNIYVNISWKSRFWKKNIDFDILRSEDIISGNNITREKGLNSKNIFL